MAEISQIINVVVTSTPSAVTQEGFGVGLVLAAHVKATPRYAVFASLAAVAAVHGSTSQIYLAASAYFAQSPAPSRIAVGRRRVDTMAFTVDTAVDGATYTLTINGTVFTLVYSDVTPTVAEVATALRALVNADGPLAVTASGATDQVILTADVAGVAFSAVAGSRMTQNALVSADTIANDLSAIQLENKDWYGLIMTDRSSANAQSAIAWLASYRKLLFTQSQEANVIDLAAGSDTTTLPAILKAASQSRASVVYHASANSVYPDAALAGRVLSKIPGSYTAMFKSLVGITVSNLTETHEANALAKNCNIYELIGGRNMIREGKVCSGSYIDQIHGRDYLVARIEEAVFDVLSSPDKVPYTDAGVALVENALRGALQNAVNIGYLSSFTISVPLVSTISAINKGNRLLPDVNFTAVESGAIHGATINGVISV